MPKSRIRGLPYEYDHVLNVSTNLVLDPEAKDYDSQKITALIDEVKLLLDRYDRANIVNAKTAKFGRRERGYLK